MQYKPEPLYVIHMRSSGGTRPTLYERTVYSWSVGIKPYRSTELTATTVPSPIDAASSRPFASGSFIE